MTSSPTIASLFTCGGMVEAGARDAGYKPIWGVEYDPLKPKLSAAFADSYELNFAAHIIRQPVQDVNWSRLPSPDLLWASPPCTRMSAANSKASESQLDFELAIAVTKAIEFLLPTAFCLENVRAYAKSRSLGIIRDCLNRLGYGIDEQILNAADFGVPQTRIRLILRAVLGQVPPRVPPPLPWVGWYEAIADLIPHLPDSALAPWQLDKLPAQLCSTIAEDLLCSNSPSIQNHAYLIERTGARSDRPLLVRPDSEPAWTIRACIGTDQNGSNRNETINAWLRAGRVVRLDARALARLQSLPDWYVLPDEIKVAGPMLGNGVPSKLCEIVLSNLKPLIIKPMVKTKKTAAPEADIKEARAEAAARFFVGDRVCHKLTLRTGKILEQCTGLAIPTFWVVWDETESQLKAVHQADPLELELLPLEESASTLEPPDTSQPDVFPDFSDDEEIYEGLEPKDEMIVENLLDTVLETPVQTATPNITLPRSNMNNFSASAATAGWDEPVSSDPRTDLQTQCKLETEEPSSHRAESSTEQNEEESLTPDEASDRQRLELRVERAFYEAGSALRELRDRRLYRSSHKTFEAYCTQRFGYNRSYCHSLIKAAGIIDNLKMSAISGHFLPTKETQVRPLSSLEPDDQPKVWQDAVERAGNKVPSARLVKQAVLRHKGIVEDIKKKKTPPCSDTYQAGQVFEISAKSGPFKKFDGCWAIAKTVNNFTLEVEVFSEVLAPVKPENLTPIDSPQECREITAIAERVRRLRESGLLDRFAYTVLEHLGKQTYLLKTEEKTLTMLESEFLDDPSKK